jgi:anti-sigma regulatory factor (Ser/Thr protein kinase)
LSAPFGLTRIELPFDLTAMSLARHHVRRRGAGLNPQLVEDAVLLASELATNAVQHGRAPVWMTIELDAQCIVVSVYDGDPSGAIELPASATIEQPGGRGLRLLDMVAREWGTESVPGGAGKCVWFELALPGAR